MPAEVALSIPPPHREAVGELLELEETAFNNLLERAGAYEGEYSFSALEALLAPELEHAGELANVLVAAHGSLPAFGSVEELSEAIARAAEAEDPASGATRFSRLFRAPPAVAMSKLLSLKGEVGRRVLATRLITDVRPAFGIEEADGDAPQDVVGMVVTHTLRIDAVHGDSVESVFYGVDEKQLRDLLQQLERARNKSERVAERFASTGLPMLKQS